MNPVLIYTDSEKINAEKSMLNKYLAVIQSVYNEYKALGITVTLQEIQNLISFTIQVNGRPDFELEFAVDKLLAMAGNYTYGGVALNSTKLRDLIQRPDITNVKAALAQVKYFSNGITGNGVRLNLLTLTEDVITKVADCDAQIEAIYTYYTKTDASTQLALDIQVVADAINHYNDSTTLPAGYPKAFPGFDGGQKLQMAAMPGIAYYDDAYRVSLSYIRHFEELQAN